MWPIIVKIPLGFVEGGLPIRAFGLMVVLAFLAATAWMKRLCRKEGVGSDDELERLFFLELIAVVVGSRLLYVVVQHEEFVGRWQDVIRIDKGGMVMYGGLLGAVVCGLTFLHRRKLPTWAIADAGGVAGALGLGIGRIGCLLVGDDYGRRVSESFPLGIMFPTATTPGSLWGLSIAPGNENLIPRSHQGQWLHPTQIYMSVNGFILAAILYALWKRKTFHGQVFWTFIILKALTRSIIEIYRDDDDRGFVGPLSTSQVIALVTAFAAFIMLLRLRARPDLRFDQAARRAAVS